MMINSSLTSINLSLQLSISLVTLVSQHRQPTKFLTSPHRLHPSTCPQTAGVLASSLMTPKWPHPPHPHSTPTARETSAEDSGVPQEGVLQVHIAYSILPPQCFGSSPAHVQPHELLFNPLSSVRLQTAGPAHQATDRAADDLEERKLVRSSVRTPYPRPLAKTVRGDASFANAARLAACQIGQELL